MLHVCMFSIGVVAGQSWLQCCIEPWRCSYVLKVEPQWNSGCLRCCRPLVLLFLSFWCTAALSSLRHAALIFRACVWSPSPPPPPPFHLSLSLSLHLLLPPPRTHILFYPPDYLIKQQFFVFAFVVAKTHILPRKRKEKENPEMLRFELSFPLPKPT